MGMRDHQSTVPVNGDKSPGKRRRDNRSMDEARVGVVAEVEGREIDKVDYQNHLSPVEVRSHKEHDKGEVEQIVHDEVAANARGGMGDFRVA